MNSLIVCSDCAAATLIAFTSSRGQRTCKGIGFASGGCFFIAPRGVVAAVGLVAAEWARASGVRAVGLAMSLYLVVHVYMITAFHVISLRCFHACMKPCLYVLPKCGGFNRGWPFRGDFDSRPSVRH